MNTDTLKTCVSLIDGMLEKLVIQSKHEDQKTRSAIMDAMDSISQAREGLQFQIDCQDEYDALNVPTDRQRRHMVNQGERE